MHHLQADSPAPFRLEQFLTFCQKQQEKAHLQIILEPTKSQLKLLVLSCRQLERVFGDYLEVALDLPQVDNKTLTIIEL